MVKIPITSPVLRTSSLSQGYVDKIDWPLSMPENARKTWCRVLAQVIAPIREHLKDTLYPLVEADSPAELQVLESEAPRAELREMMARLRTLEAKLEQFEVSWVSSAQAVAELELTLCKQKVDRIKATVPHFAQSSIPQLAQSSVPSPAAREVASPVAAASDVEEEAHAPSRGRKQDSKGSRARTVSPLMVPVLWGMGEGAATALVPLPVVQSQTRGTGGCIIRRSTPDAHPKWRLVATQHPDLMPFRPQ